MLKYNLFLIALCCLTLSTEARNGIIDGIQISSMKDFPHEVSILTTEYDGRKHFCSGSIINPNWILSSTRCVYHGENYELIFNRTNLNDKHSNSFSLNVDNSSVYRHPNHDLALFHLPMKLKFSPYVKAVKLLSNAQHNLTDRFAVMPGIANGTLKMSYGLFDIISPQECSRVYGNLYDEKTQICTQGYRNNSNVPCENNEGGGLLINWPFDPVLVGIFNSPLSCLSRIPAEYMRITAFVDWINSVIRSEHN